MNEKSFDFFSVVGKLASKEPFLGFWRKSNEFYESFKNKIKSNESYKNYINKINSKGRVD